MWRSKNVSVRYFSLYWDFWYYILAIYNKYHIRCYNNYNNRANKKKIIKKDNKFTIVIYAIIITFCILVSKNLGYSVTKYLSAKPDKVYTEMKEINDSKRLIGLSKEQVIQLLGKPRGKEEKDVYYYDAGNITDYLFFGEIDSYELKIIFDENDKVKYTSIKEAV